MHLKISSKLFSLSNKKDIYLNGENLYSMEPTNIVGDYCLKLIELKSGFVKALIVRKTNFLSDSFTIRLLNEGNFPILFCRNVRWKHNYNCVYNGTKYRIEEIKKKYVIIRNDIIVAKWIKVEYNSFVEEDNFEILDSCNELEFIISMCLIIYQKEIVKRNPS
ncbi:MAG: hypothetical protein LDL23_09740 [Flavobacterium sp.]|jgi:hypothetical protein|uniref:hypothetical protein n=1 Tax=Flavobacterium sp. TaxID=239 RepID=UPI0025C0E7EB|nr:hypothetical protein [Flavobacterium sp.]MCA1966917.1 hypothetical protein [Flavobacterium sp.]